MVVTPVLSLSYCLVQHKNPTEAFTYTFMAKSAIRNELVSSDHILLRAR